MELGKDTAITIAITSLAGIAASTNLNGVILDMEGFESVLAIVNFGVITATGVQGLKWQQDVVVGFGGAQDLLGSAQVVADDDVSVTWEEKSASPRYTVVDPVETAEKLAAAGFDSEIIRFRSPWKTASSTRGC